MPAALPLGAAGAQAASFTLSGQITHHNDLVQLDFSSGLDDLFLQAATRSTGEAALLPKEFSEKESVLR